MLCVGVRSASGSCPRMNSVLSALLIGARSEGERELIVSITRVEMMTEEFMVKGVLSK